MIFSNSMMMCPRLGLPPGTFILGDTGTASIDNGLSANYMVARKFTASTTGNMVTFKLTARGSGNVKVGVYTDTGALPGTLLSSTGSVAVVSGANSISIASTALVSGTAYWLCANSSIASLLASSVGSAGTSRYAALTFSSAFPSTWPGGSSGALWQLEYSGYS